MKTKSNRSQKQVIPAKEKPSIVLNTSPEIPEDLPIRQERFVPRDGNSYRDFTELFIDANGSANE